MEFDFSWLLLGLPTAFVLGWLASRFDFHQWRIDNRQAPKAYFKGLNFLLNEQQDQAIDAFIEAVQNDSDTSELHFALGNLFRRRAEYDRAVRVHEHLLSRADLTQADRDRAQHALAMDYLKAGLLDRAENALQALENTAFENAAHLALLSIYERSRDWKQAALIAQRLDEANQGRYNTRQAHYWCEQALGLVAQNQFDQFDSAVALLKQAQKIAPQAARPWILCAELQAKHQQTSAAFDCLLRLSKEAPLYVPLAVVLWIDLAKQTKQEARLLALFESHYENSHSLDVLQGLIALDECLGVAPKEAQNRYVKHLEHEPSLVAAAHWIKGEKLEHEQFHPQIQKALDHAIKPLTRYRCAACGFEAKLYFWQCPGCQSWDSYPAQRVVEL